MAGTHELAQEAGCTHETVVSVVDAIARMVARDESVRIRGFGVFEKRKVKARKWKSAGMKKLTKTSVTHDIPEHWKIHFRQTMKTKRRRAGISLAPSSR